MLETKKYIDHAGLGDYNGDILFLSLKAVDFSFAKRFWMKIKKARSVFFCSR